MRAISCREPMAIEFLLFFGTGSRLNNDDTYNSNLDDRHPYNINTKPFAREERLVAIMPNDAKNNTKNGIVDRLRNREKSVSNIPSP
jgi:hypothetical protein